MAREDTPFEVEGTWGLPGEDAKFRGTLKIQVSGAALLNIEIPGINLSPTLNILNCPLIHGFTKNGNRITLWRNVNVGLQRMTFGDPSVSIMGIRPAYVFTNIHFDNEAEIAFDTLNFHYQNLSDWLLHRPITHKVTKGLYDFQIRFKKPRPINVKVGDWHLNFDSGWSVNSTTLSSEIKSYAYCSIHNSATDSKADFSEYINVGDKLSVFLSLCMGHPTTYAFVEGWFGTQSVDIYFARQAKPIEENVRSPMMLLRYSDIQRNRTRLLKNWFKTASKYEPIIGLLEGIWHRSSRSIYPEFLQVTQALEAFHARHFGGSYIPNQEYIEGLYQTLVAALPSTLDADFKQSLKAGKLYYANRYSLRKRLEELGAYLVPLNLKFLTSQRQVKSFAKTVSSSRNYYTHYDASDKADALEGAQLAKMNGKLQLILQLLLLLECGIPKEQLATQLSKWPLINISAYKA